MYQHYRFRFGLSLEHRFTACVERVCGRRLAWSQSVHSRPESRGRHTPTAHGPRWMRSRAVHLQSGRASRRALGQQVGFHVRRSDPVPCTNAGVDRRDVRMWLSTRNLRKESQF
jgi:hypothetical protein